MEIYAVCYASLCLAVLPGMVIIDPPFCCLADCLVMHIFAASSLPMVFLIRGWSHHPHC